MTDAIILIGIKHSGKSTQGKLLAKKSDRIFIDLDDVITELSGCFESAVYYLNSLHRAQIRHAELIYSLIFTRMISSDLIHAFCAGLSAFSVFAAKNKKIYISPVIISILIHGIFDLFQYFDNAIKYFSIVQFLSYSVAL